MKENNIRKRHSDSSLGDNIIEELEKSSYRWNQVIIAIASIIIVVIMVLILADVSGRYLLNSPISGTVEIGQICLAFVAFLSLAWGLIKEVHVRMRLVFDRMNYRLQLKLSVLAGILGLIFFTALVIGGFKHFWDSFIVREIMMAAIKLPFWVPKLMLLIGALLMVIQCIIYTLHNIKLLLKRKEI